VIPIAHMAGKPRRRMGPPTRSFAADAYVCITVPIREDQPHTSLRRVIAPDGELSSRFAVICPAAVEVRLTTFGERSVDR
jgi:hypothetical protein